MFTQRQNRTMFQAAFSTMALIYHQTSYNLRTNNRNALVGLLINIGQSLLMVIVILGMFHLIGIRRSPLRGDFLLYVMSGIFIFMTHVKSVGAVSGAHSISSGILKHEPLNAAVLIFSAAIAALYQQALSLLVILAGYYLLFQPFTIYDPVGVAAMVGVAWLSGCCIGLVFLGLRPWNPAAVGMLTMLYQRVNMFASGKLFVANVLPNFLLPWFIWNPLFHIIDQTRGFMFINYSPQKTDIMYPIYVSVAMLMIGLLINFTTRKYESISWAAR